MTENLGTVKSSLVSGGLETFSPEAERLEGIVMHIVENVAS